MTQYELEVRENDDPGVVLAYAVGELDLTNAPDLEQRLEELRSNTATLVLDLNGVSFVDSAALHALFRVARVNERFGIVLESASPIARTFGIVGLDKVARVRPSAEELLEELNS